MEVFFAGMPNINILARFYDLTGIKVNILKNYYELQDKDFKKEILAYKPYVSKIMLDSGAFSANNSLGPNEAEAIKQRYPIFLKAHSDFIKEYIYRVFSYDYRFDQEGFTDNFTMFVKLYNVYKSICPVIHTFTKNGDNPEVDEYSEFKSPTMAIGQIINEETGTRIDRTSKNTLKYLQATINSIKQTDSDCHLFGIMNYEALKELTNYDTCDSTSWNTYARTGTAIIFWDRIQSTGNPFFGYYNFPQHLKTNNNAKPFDSLDINLKDLFFDDMKKILKLEKYDFYNSKATVSLELANLYYSIKFSEYINTLPTQFNPLSTNSSNTQKVNTLKPIEQEVSTDSSVESVISELLAISPFENIRGKQIEPEIVDKAYPDTDPFKMAEPRDTLQEFANTSVPNKNPFTSLRKEREKSPSETQKQDKNSFE